MRNWLELNKGNFGYLFEVYRPVKKVQPWMLQLWEQLYDEYIEKVGLSNDFKAYISQMKMAAIAIANHLENPDSLNGTRRAEAEQKLEQMSGGTKGGNFPEFWASVEKYMGFSLDIEKVTVSNFYGYVNLMKREAEAVSHGK